MYKVLTIVGTRPELIKLSATIPKFDECFNHMFVHTGQNYDKRLAEVFYDDLNLRKPDKFLNVATSNLADDIGNIISKSDQILSEFEPDAMLVLGDTNSCLSVISAKRRKIPIFHLEAGNRCYDQNVPEEINRKIIDHISDINLTYRQIAKQNLIREGLPNQNTICIGSPMKEVLDRQKARIENSEILTRLGLTPGSFFLASAHREENVDDEANLLRLLGSFEKLSNQHKKPIVFSVHPRTQRRISSVNFKLSQNIQLHPPFSFSEYAKLQKNARCVLSDSGTLTEEASLMGFPAVNIRNTHERPEGDEQGICILSGLSYESISQAVELQVGFYNSSASPPFVRDYEVNSVSTKLVKIISSYIGYVNRNTWRKSVI